MVEEKGLRYNEGKPKWSLVHYKSLIPMIRVLEYGAHKYSTFIDDENYIYKGSVLSQKDVNNLTLTLLKSGKENWKNPLNREEILESIQRHIAALMDGEELDSESGISHMGHIQANAMFYNYHYTK